MDEMKKGSKRKRLIPANPAADFIDTDTVLHRNQILESSGLDNFLIRLPRLKLHVHFYYKFVEGGTCTVGDHNHQFWEIVRICLGKAIYPVRETGDYVRPGPSQYLIIPPKMTHGWSMSRAPLMINSWQVRIEAEDEIGEQVLESLKKKVIYSGFLVPATSCQIQAEALLWQVSGEERNPQLFGSMLSGFTRIVIGDLFAKLNPWPDNLLTAKHDPDIVAEALAQRLRIFLDENIENSINLSDLIGHFHFSDRHLNRIFQKAHQVSIGQYLRQQRVELAKRWLETTDRAIKDIALSLGYSTAGQFCHYFNVRTGATPSQYRDHQKKIRQERADGSVIRSNDTSAAKK